jgi:hypothetical protein
MSALWDLHELSFCTRLTSRHSTLTSRSASTLERVAYKRNGRWKDRVTYPLPGMLTGPRNLPMQQPWVLAPPSSRPISAHFMLSTSPGRWAVSRIMPNAPDDGPEVIEHGEDRAHLLAGEDALSPRTGEDARRLPLERPYSGPERSPAQLVPSRRIGAGPTADR